MIIIASYLVILPLFIYFIVTGKDNLSIILNYIDKIISKLFNSK